ncbi:hypothetical protein BDZ97DRAFT_1616205, partial [Flammula alnicola]
VGSRPAKYKFDLADFAAYETLRDSFLLARPQGHRALCYGGIIARLARETLPNSVVFPGPSQSALQGNYEAFTDHVGSLVDDTLPEDVLDFICGAYEVGTGIGNQIAIQSWFPRYNTWDGSGLNVGHWNDECEEWYLKRRDEILAGKTKPLSGNEWRQKLRMTRHAPKLVFQMNKAALSFL